MLANVMSKRAAADRNSQSKQQSRRMKRLAALAIMATSVQAVQLLMPRSASAANILLNGSDGSNTSSFQYGPTYHWTGGLAPVAGNTYEDTGISGSDLIRVYSGSGGNTSAGSATFAGTSLQLDTNGYLLSKFPGNVTANLILNGGIFDDYSSDTLLGNISLNAGSGSYISARGGVILTVNSLITGSGNLNVNAESSGAGAASGQGTQTFSGTVILNAANTFTGSTSDSLGTLQLGNANALQYSTLVPAGGALTFSTGITSAIVGGLSGSGNLNFSGGTLAIGNNNGNTTYSGVLGGTGNLNKIGTGTLTLTGSNVYTGLTTPSAGTLLVGSANALGNSTVNLSSGTLSFTSGLGSTTFGGLTGSSNLALSDIAAGAVTVSFGNNNASTGYSGSLTGIGGLTKMGTGITTLSGTSSFSGPTTINSGGLLVSGNLGANTAVTVYSPGFLTGVGNGASGIVGGSVTVNGGGAIDFTKDGATTTVQKLTVGSLNLATGGSASSAANLTYNVGSQGSDTIATGTLNLTPGGQAYINLGGTVAVNGTYTLLTYGSQTGIAPVGSYTNGTANEPFVLGTTFPGLITYTFNDTSTALTLQIAATANPALAYWYGAYAASTGGNTATGTFGGNNANPASPLTNFSSNPAGTADAGQVPGVNTDVVFAASTLSGQNINATLETNYVINSLTINSSPASTTIGGTGNLTLNAGSGSLYSGGGTGIVMTSGAGALTINTTGQVIAARSQSWTNNSANPLTISSGIAGAATTGNTTSLTVGNLNTGGTALSGTVADGTGGGSLALVINNPGSGVTTLSGTNTYSGGTTINAGTLSISADANLGAVPATAGTNITLNGGTLQVNFATLAGAANGTINPHRSILLGASGGTINVPTVMTGTFTTSGVESSTVYDGAITGTGGLTITGGTGTNSPSSAYLIELGSGNTYTGNTTINNATLSFTTVGLPVYNNVLPVTTVLNIVNNGIFDFANGASSQTLAGLSGDSTADLGTTNGTSLDVLTINPAAGTTYTFSGTIAALSIPTKTGSNKELSVVIGNGTATGTEIFAGANLYSGTTNLSSGTLQLGNANAIASSTVIMAGGNLGFSPSIGTFTIGGLQGTTGNITLADTSATPITLAIGAGNSTTTYAGLFSGSGNISLVGGTLILTGSSPFTGNTILTAGTLQLGNANAISNSTLVPAGGNLNFSAGITSAVVAGLSGSGNLNFSGGTLAVGNNNASSTYSGTLSGTGNLTKVGTGTLTLTGSNAFTGLTTPSAGTLLVGSPNALASSNVNVSTGTLSFASGLGNATLGGLTGTGNLALVDSTGGAVALSVGNNNANTTYSATLTDAGAGGSLIKIGTGITTLAGSSTYTGATLINMGGLLVSGKLGAGTAVTVNSPGFLTGVGNGASGIVGGSVTVNGGGAIDFTKDGATTTVQKLTVGSLNLATGGSASSAANLTYNVGSQGSDTIATGTLNLTPGGQAYINLGGTVAVNGTYTLLTYGSQTGIAPVGSYTNGTANEPFVLGTTFPGLITYTFNDTSTALTLQIAATANPALAYWYGAYAASTGGNTATGTFGGNNANPASPLTNFSSNPAGTADAGQVPGVNTDVVFAASTLSGQNINATLETNYVINSLTINSSPASTTIGGTGNLTLNAGSGSLYSGGGTGIVMTSGAGALTINTTGQVIAARSQSWTNNSANPLTISSGIAGAATTGNTTSLTVGNLNTGGTALSGTVADGTGGGSLALVINNPGSGVTTLSGTNTYSGGTTINAGTLSISADANLGAVPATAGTNITLNGGTLQVNAVTTAVAGAVTINTNRSILLGSAGGTINVPITGSGNFNTGGSETDTIYDGAITGGGGLTVTGGSGTNSASSPYLIVLGPGNTYAGNTTINNATVSYTNFPPTANVYNNVLPVTTVLNIVNNGIFDFANGASSQTLAGLTGDATSVVGTSNGTSADVLTINPATGTTYTFSGTIGGITLLNKAGAGKEIAVVIGNGTTAGTEIFAGANAYSGTTTVNSGTLKLANNSATGGSAVTVAAGALLSVSNHGAGPVIVPTLATLANNGTIDLTNNALVVTTGNITANIAVLTGEIRMAYAGGLWNGNNSTGASITSSLAAADPAHLTAVGIATGFSSFEGAAVPVTAVLLKYTYYGDANLDGHVDGSDYSLIDNAYVSNQAYLASNPGGTTFPYSGWDNGDFNYDGVIDGSDYTLIDNAFNTQGASIQSQIATATAQIGGGGTTSAVPEPASLGLLGLGAAGILGRRRRSR